MKINKNYPIQFAVLLFVLCCLTTGVYSYMFKKTNTISNQFIPGFVDCVVDEELDGTSKIGITVENTGNIDAYIRVRLVTYWVNENDIVVSKPSDILSFELSNDWVKGKDNTYYYSKSVAPNSSTSDLLNDVIVLKTEDGYYQAVDVFAEAIQAKPTNAVIDTWKVSLDAEGNIISD